MVLLRAVGHVLKKIDGASGSQYESAIDRWWTTLKSTKPVPQIFWGFIDEERNNIVKEYQTNAGQGVTIQLSGVSTGLRTGEQKVNPPNPPIYHYTMDAGPFQGRDQRDLIAKAIQWWETQLDAIDRDVSSHTS